MKDEKKQRIPRLPANQKYNDEIQALKSAIIAFEVATGSRVEHISIDEGRVIRINSEFIAI